MAANKPPVAGNTFAKLCEIVAQLRAPGGCPWDREQSNESLISALIEEAYEVAAAVRASDDENLREELGDLILVAVMHSEIARENGRFTIDEVLAEVTAKLIRRHPHVFGPVAAGVSPAQKSAGAADTAATTAAAVVKQWDAIKREEKAAPNRHYLADMPAALPALMRAQKVQNKVARVQFDWNGIAEVVAKVEEELAEAKEAVATDDPKAMAEEIGDLLFAVVNLARKAKLDAEQILHAATDKFVGRFAKLEDRLHATGRELGQVQLKELDEIWESLKTERDSQPA